MWKCKSGKIAVKLRHLNSAPKRIGPLCSEDQLPRSTTFPLGTPSKCSPRYLKLPRKSVGSLKFIWSLNFKHHTLAESNFSSIQKNWSEPLSSWIFVKLDLCQVGTLSSWYFVKLDFCQAGTLSHAFAETLELKNQFTRLDVLHSVVI